MTDNLICVAFWQGGRGGTGEIFDEFCSDCFAAFQDLRIFLIFIIA
jgi:hypothetical protein